MKTKHLRPLKAIRQYCLDCMGGRPSLVRTCDTETCALHSLRFGKNPLRKGLGGRLIINRQSQHKLGNQLNDSGALISSEGKDTAVAASGSLGAMSGVNSKAKVKVVKHGMLQIQETETELLIKLTQ